jgi:hypothetical protein
LNEILDNSNEAIKLMKYSHDIDLPHDVTGSQVMASLYETGYFAPLADFLLQDVPLVS